MNLPAPVRRLLCLWLSLGLALLPLRSEAGLADELPDIGSASSTLFTPAQEKALGKSFMRYVRATQKVIEDPLLDDYINQLGNKLVEHSSAKGSHFRFFLVDDPVINAFAGPGGYIGVYTGLLLTTQSEAELAAVLAHEITHVTQKHLQRSWHAASNMSLVQGAALLAAVILGATTGGDAALAATLGAQAAVQQQQINFTRHNEKEADRLGIETLYASRFDPTAMPTFFKRMGRSNRSYGAQLPEFLRTHPVTNSRIADALGRAQKFPYVQTEDSLRYLLVRARLQQQRIENPAQAILHFRKALQEGRYRDQAATRYGLVLALIRDHQLDKASREIQTLLQKHPRILEFIIADAQIDMERHQQPKAIIKLEKALVYTPLSYPLHITLAEAYLRANQPQKAYDLLKKWLRLKPEKPGIYKLLARVTTELDKPVESHEYLAAYFYLIGELESSALQLKLALRSKDLNFYQTARLESQLDKVTSEINDLKKEKP